MDNLVPCEQCSTLIEGVQQSMFLGMLAICRRTLCSECQYAENFRVNACVTNPPYRTPFPRPTKDGKMPAVLREALAKVHEAKKAGGA